MALFASAAITMVLEAFGFWTVRAWSYTKSVRWSYKLFVEFHQNIYNFGPSLCEYILKSFRGEDTFLTHTVHSIVLFQQTLKSVVILYQQTAFCQSDARQM